MTITLTNNDALNQFVRSNHLAVLFFFNEPYASTNLEFVNKAQPFFRKTRDNWPNWKFAQFNNENVTVPKTLHEIKSQMGIIFYVRGVCIGHMQSFDEEKYKKAMDTLPGLVRRTMERVPESQWPVVLPDKVANMLKDLSFITPAVPARVNKPLPQLPPNADSPVVPAKHTAVKKASAKKAKKNNGCIIM